MKAVQLGLLFVLLMGLMVVSVGVEMVEPQQLGEIGLALLAWVESLYPPAALYRLGVCQGEWLSFLLFSLGSLLVFLLFCWGVGKCFGWLHTALTTYSRRKSYRIGKIESQKPFHALYCKEWKRYLSSPVYVLNTAFGMVLLTVGAVALLFFPKGTFEAVMASQGMGGASISISNLAAFLICFLVSTVCTSASSISLEGKQLWLIKSLPVTARMIFRAKLAVNFTLFIPLIPDCVLLWYLLSLDLFSLAKILFLSVVFAVFTALFGLLANLKFPNLPGKPKLPWSSKVLPSLPRFYAV